MFYEEHLSLNCINSLDSSARLMINEIARETQCFSLPCHSTQGRFDFTNIIIENKSVEARTRDIRLASNARSPLDQAVSVQHRNRIEYYNNFYCSNKRARS